MWSTMEIVMFPARMKIVSIAAVAGMAIAWAASAQAQDYRYHRYHYAHPIARSQFYNAQNYMIGGPNILPTTEVIGVYYDDYYSEYGCCGSSRNNERIGLVGAGGGAGFAGR